MSTDRPTCYKVKKDIILPDGRNGMRLKDGDFIHAEEISVREEFLSGNPDFFEKIPSYLIPAVSYERLFEDMQQVMEQMSNMFTKEEVTEIIKDIQMPGGDRISDYDFYLKDFKEEKLKSPPSLHQI